jgi:hypothetical protein
LLVVLRDDPFLAVVVRDVVAGAEVVEHLFTLEAELRLERVVAIVEPCVDHLGRVLLSDKGFVGFCPDSSRTRTHLRISTACLRSNGPVALNYNG